MKRFTLYAAAHPGMGCVKAGLTKSIGGANNRVRDYVSQRPHLQIAGWRKAMEITIRTNHRVVAEQVEQRLFNIMRYGEHLYGNPPHEDREVFNVPWKFGRDALKHVAAEFNLQERMVRAIDKQIGFKPFTLARREKPREKPATVADNIIRLRA